MYRTYRVVVEIKWQYAPDDPTDAQAYLLGELNDRLRPEDRHDPLVTDVVSITGEGSKAYYIYAEDLVGALVGPFNSISAAEEHMLFCEERGDAATTRVVDETEARALTQEGVHTYVTAEKDRKWQPRKGE